MRLQAKYLSLIGAALMIAGPMAMAADAASSYSANAENQGNADLSADWLCGNGSGNKIHLGGTAKFKGVGMSVRFEATGNRSNHYDAVATDGIELTLDQTVDSPKQPSRGGAGGNPFIYFIAKDANGRQLAGSDPVLLGRCNGPSSGASRVQARVAAGIASLASVGATGCDNKGTQVTSSRRHDKALRGAVVLSNRIDLKGIVTEDQDTAITDFSMGNVGAPKQGNISTGVGGNPTIKILMWKTRGDADTALPTLAADGTFAFADDNSSADIYSTDANGNKGYRTLGRCSDLRTK